MCTVVARWQPGEPALVMALRDELVGRPFDPPGAWWPDQPSVVGGRDRVAGGSWCVSDVRSGVAALVLNRPQRRTAEAGAPSRGVLPLLAVEHGQAWPAQLDLAGMASFALLLVAPGGLTLWTYDGSRLASAALEPGTHMVTSGGAEDGKAERYLPAFEAQATAAQWQALLHDRLPQDDVAALVVRHAMPTGATYATVFGQVFQAAPGALTLSWSREPWDSASWTTTTYDGTPPPQA